MRALCRHTSFSVAVIALFGAFAQPAHAMEDAASQLVSAIMSNNPMQARAAIAAGADVNADTGEGRTPLILAAMTTKPEIARILIENGADPRKQAQMPATGNAVTAAFFAMNGTKLTGRTDEPDAKGHADALEVLRLVAKRMGELDEHGLDLPVRRATTNLTALMMAAEAGAADAVHILLDAGADPNAMNAGRYTALDYAVERPPVWSQASAADRDDVVRALIAAGAKTDHKPADGVTPKQRAERAGNARFVSLMNTH